MIRTHGLTRSFGSVLAVDHLDLEVRRGEVFGLIGPNGAGKTTTVRLLCCLLGPTSGTAEVLGYPLGTEATSEQIRKRVGFLPENHGLYERLSAYRNLDFFAQLYGVTPERRAERIEELLRLFGVWDRRNDAIATFSRGMRQKIAIARAIVHDPELLFLDEPTANLDPEAAQTVRQVILDLRKEGRTIFLNTHNLDEVERICDRIGVLRNRLLAVGVPEELVRQRFGHWTKIELRSAVPAVVDAIARSREGREVHAEGPTISVRVDDPDVENPALARLAIEHGGDLVSIHEVEVGLEAFYLSLVGGSE
jgi:ABC-2 type transport system ATP-binding protein